MALSRNLYSHVSAECIPNIYMLDEIQEKQHFFLSRSLSDSLLYHINSPPSCTSLFETNIKKEPERKQNLPLLPATNRKTEVAQGVLLSPTKPTPVPLKEALSAMLLHMQPLQELPTPQEDLEQQSIRTPFPTPTHLPLLPASNWKTKVAQGVLLSPTKPTQVPLKEALSALLHLQPLMELPTPQEDLEQQNIRMPSPTPTQYYSFLSHSTIIDMTNEDEQLSQTEHESTTYISNFPKSFLFLMYAVLIYNMWTLFIGSYLGVPYISKEEINVRVLFFSLFLIFRVQIQIQEDSSRSWPIIYSIGIFILIYFCVYYGGLCYRRLTRGRELQQRSTEDIELALISSYEQSTYANDNGIP